MKKKCSVCSYNNNGWCNYHKTNRLCDKISECGEPLNVKYHDLNIKPNDFESVLKGIRTFWTTFNDRDFKVNDVIILREWENNEYSERKIVKTISYKLEGEQYGLQYNYCILGLK